MNKEYDTYVKNTLKMIRYFQKKISPTMCKTDAFFKDFTVLEEAKDNRNGEIYKNSVCIRAKECSDTILKITPLSEQDISYYTQNRFYRSSSLIELYIFKLLTELHKKKVCPNLPFIYTSALCLGDCSFTLKDILKSYDNIQGCLLTFTPKAENTLKYFLKEKKRLSTKAILQIFFQIFVGLYVLYNQFSVEHHDLHYKNVLYIKTPGSIQYYTYILKTGEKVTIECPFTFYLWDFGISRFDNTGWGASGYTSAHKENKENYGDFFDFANIVGTIPSQYKEARGILKKCIRTSSTREEVLINMIPFLPKHQGKTGVNFNISKKVKIPSVKVFTTPQEKVINEYVDSQGFFSPIKDSVTKALKSIFSF
jgi:hypothetical protein